MRYRRIVCSFHKFSNSVRVYQKERTHVFDYSELQQYRTSKIEISLYNASWLLIRSVNASCTSYLYLMHIKFEGISKCIHCIFVLTKWKNILCQVQMWYEKGKYNKSVPIWNLLSAQKQFDSLKAERTFSDIILF